MPTEEEDAVVLGGNIHLAGFKEIDSSSMTVAKKMIGNHVHRFGELSQVEELKITVKKIHEREKSEKYELQARLRTDGRFLKAEAVDRNLFFAIDAVMKRLESEIEHNKP